MEQLPESFSAVIRLWDSAASLARDLGLKEVTVRAWRTRDAIPPEYWKAIEAAAAARGFGIPISADLLANLAARSKTHSLPTEGAAA